MPRPRAFRGEDSRPIKPSSLFLIVQSLVSCIEGSPGQVAATIGVTPTELNAFYRLPDITHHAYWEWAVNAIQPTVWLTTPLGRCNFKLLSSDDRFIETQYIRRVTNMLGAHCSLAGSQTSVRDSQRITIDLFAEPMPEGTVEFDDPIDLVCDIIATQRVPISNVPLVTGVPVAFLENCVNNADALAIRSIRTLWSIASRLGCTMTLVNGRRTYVLSPSEPMVRPAIVACTEGHKREICKASEFTGDIRDIVSGKHTIQEAAALHQISRQAVLQRLKAHGITANLLKSNERLFEARKVLARHLV